MMKKLLLFIPLIFVLASSCTKQEEGTKYGKIAIFWGDDSYSAVPGETVSIPFTINGTQGVAVDVEALVSDSEFGCKLKVNADYTGTVNVTVPEIVLKEKSVDVTLKVDDDANSRHAELSVPLKVTASEPLSISLTADIKSVAVKPGKSFDVPFKVSGLSPAVKSDIKYETTSGWSAATKSWDDASACGSVTVTAPSSLPEKMDLTINFTDSKGRTASGKYTVGIVEIHTAAGAANCFVVKPGSTLTINAVKGNSTEKLSFNNAALLWQDAKGMVKSVSGNGTEGVVVVSLASGVSGNAVVAARKDETVVWSWHIWVSDYDPTAKPFVWTSKDSGKTYTFMDRNLGALNAAKYSKLALGLLYQWGRKDPFPGGDDVESQKAVVLYDADGEVVHTEVEERPSYGTDYTKTNLQLAIQNPMVFYTAPSSAWPVVDWLTDKAELQNNDLWGNVSNAKSVYDPCPEGWWVPATGDCWGFRKEYKKDGKLTDTGKYDPSYPWYQEYDDAYCIGFRYKTADGTEFWFPQAGYRNCNTGALQSVGGSGQFHTRSDNSNTVWIEQMAWGNPASETGLNRPYGSSIRCIKE